MNATESLATVAHGLAVVQRDALALRSALPVRIGLSAEEKDLRRHTLGSSEIAAVCGVNPYASIHNVWMSKCLGVDFEGNEATELGQLLEPSILAIYCGRYNKRVIRGKYTTGPEPWMSATPDAEIVGEDGLMEAKLVGLRSIWQWGHGNTDETESDAIPLHYLSQCQWQMLVTGRSFVTLSALMGTEFRSYTIRANADVQDRLMTRGREFWDRHVLTRQEPPVDGSRGAREMLKALYPRSADAEAIAATEQLNTYADALLAARKELDRAEYAKQEAENLIKAELKDARGAYGEDWRIRYATTKAGKRPFVFEHEKEKTT